jgi:hypothetical protein
MIQNLQPNQIFVFGSNLAGAHAGGAARQAKEQFGAEEGVGEGFTGQCYAFPTLDRNFRQLSHERLVEEVASFYGCARHNPRLAGFSHEYMKSLFKDPPPNVVLPEEWREEEH